MNDLITIRDFKKSDWTYVKEIYQQGLDSNIATFQTVCPSFEEWDEGHLKDCRFVALYNDKVVGFAVLSPTSKREVYRGVVEVSIYLDTQFKNNGIGTLLLNHLIDDSEKRGFWSLYSSIIEENIGSIALHAKCGFKKVGYRENIAKDRLGNWHNTILFERRSSLIM